MIPRIDIISVLQDLHVYMVLIPPSMFRSTVDEVDYDPWGDDQDVQIVSSGRENAEWERMAEEFTNVCKPSNQ